MCRFCSLTEMLLHSLLQNNVATAAVKKRWPIWLLIWSSVLACSLFRYDYKLAIHFAVILKVVCAVAGGRIGCPISSASCWEPYGHNVHCLRLSASVHIGILSNKDHNDIWFSFFLLKLIHDVQISVINIRTFFPLAVNNSNQCNIQVWSHWEVWIFSHWRLFSCQCASVCPVGICWFLFRLCGALWDACGWNLAPFEYKLIDWNSWPIEP